jgi:hypothetical protein
MPFRRWQREIISSRIGMEEGEKSARSREKAYDIGCSRAATKFSNQNNFLLFHTYNRESALQVSLKLFSKI